MTMLKPYTLLLFSSLFAVGVHAQEQGKRDSLPMHLLDSVVVRTSRAFSETPYLPPVKGMGIYSGKKTNIVLPDRVN